MVTGFCPQPNYILASTASIAFLMSAATAHWLIAWHHQVPLSLALVLSSIWFHTQKTYTAYVADQLMISFWVVGAVYEAYMRGPIPVSLTILVLTYNMLVFYAGWIGNCYAFDPDPLISTFFHSTLHFVSFLGVIGVLMSQQKTELLCLAGSVRNGLSARECGS